MLDIDLCVECGLPLPTTAGRGRPRKAHVECLGALSIRYYAERYARQKATRAQHTKRCVACLTEFSPGHGNEDYCSDACRFGVHEGDE